MRIFSLVGVLLLLTSLYLAASVPVFSEESQTVNATVTVQDAACITVTSSGISYGTRALSTTGNPVQASGNIPSLASCSGSAQTVHIKGTGATGSTPAWTLVSALSCPTANQFVHEFDNPNTAGGFLALGLSNITFGSLASMASIPNIPTRITMPCTGSSGAGLQVSTQIIFTATIP